MLKDEWSERCRMIDDVARGEWSINFEAGRCVVLSDRAIGRVVRSEEK